MQHPPPLPPQQRQLQNIHRDQTFVTSCEEEDDDDDLEHERVGYRSSSDDDDDDDNNLDSTGTTDAKPATAAAVSSSDHLDYLYDAQADEEDAAYVYRHLRSGVAETVRIASPPPNATPTTTTKPDRVSDNAPRLLVQQQKLLSSSSSSPAAASTAEVYRPRTSDAVLSCPSCFQIVCMDCQEHESYPNLYRAMFVMGVVVKWNDSLRYHESSNYLVPLGKDEYLATKRDMIEETAEDGDGTVTYYTVCCSNCQTTVAALDMTDEVYYFSGCLTAAA